ncbi:uncharacterized protein BCR38DRAFT_418070 [Pseudomassariella vexata]|uniref:NAD(P)-binding domain-containing protein n=1 Tax=Pseudomassariella vexata TaxID=1141098 RepID=A0A1Y2EJR8_9PEZI|nr:uncharacterized protein BCR38DRAFT_418070 [Pseudomassariella vexata]ORY71790.1 hypothetical protein BCR38DRAFT_418070 [Pseudomassariella vexata]
MASTRLQQCQGAVLLLGGTGKVASRIAPKLKAANIPLLIASRSGRAPEGYQAVKFEWLDRMTWETSLSAAPAVRAVFIVFQGFVDPSAMAKDFVDYARGLGVDRFVLLSQSPVDENGPAFGQIHRYLRELGDRGKIGWAVLRPTWFQQNFSELGYHIQSIKKENKIYSASGRGKIPWISCDDIAAVGYHCLTTSEPPNTDFLILGPELLGYDELADIFTQVLGRKIVHHNLTPEGLEQQYQKNGVSPEFANFLAELDKGIEIGAENRKNDVFFATMGYEPRKFRDFVKANQAVWQ